MAADTDVKLDMESLSGLQFEPLGGGGAGVEGAISSGHGPDLKSFPDEEESYGKSDRDKLMSEESSSSTTSSWFSFLSLEYYQGLCDITTSDVIKRILAGLSPLPFNLALAVTSNPDMYGPFWLCMTLILTTAISGNIAKFFSGNTAWEFNVHQVIVLGTVVYSYTWLVPTVLWMLLVWRRTTDRYSLLQLLAIYGYSISIFIPLTLLWLINVNILRWVLLAVAVLMSGSVLVRALWRPLKNESPKLAVIILVLLFLLHAGVAVGFKFYYFSSSFAPADHTTASPMTHLTNITTQHRVTPHISHPTLRPSPLSMRTH